MEKKPITIEDLAAEYYTQNESIITEKVNVQDAEWQTPAAFGIGFSVGFTVACSNVLRAINDPCMTRDKLKQMLNEALTMCHATNEQNNEC